MQNGPDMVELEVASRQSMLFSLQLCLYISYSGQTCMLIIKQMGLSHFVAQHFQPLPLELVLSLVHALFRKSFDSGCQLEKVAKERFWGRGGFGGRGGGRGDGGRGRGGGGRGLGARGGIMKPRGGGRGGGGRRRVGGRGGGRGGMKGGSKVIVEPHRHAGVFIAKGKEDALVTKNMVAGKSVYNEKRISVQQEDGTKVEYRYGIHSDRSWQLPFLVVLTIFG